MHQNIPSCEGNRSHSFPWGKIQSLRQMTDNTTFPKRAFYILPSFYTSAQKLLAVSPWLSTPPLQSLPYLNLCLSAWQLLKSILFSMKPMPQPHKSSKAGPLPNDWQIWCNHLHTIISRVRFLPLSWGELSFSHELDRNHPYHYWDHRLFRRKEWRTAKKTQTKQGTIFHCTIMTLLLLPYGQKPRPH